MSRIRGIIFDLDDTLFDCTGQLTEPARRRASDLLIRNLTDISLDSMTRLQRELSARFGSTGAIREIGKRYEIDEPTIDAALETYNRDDVPEVVPFPDALDTLNAIVAMGTHLSLVTTGRMKRQLAKIERLGLSAYFVHGRNVFIHDPAAGHPEKDNQMLQAIESAKLTAADTACIGDKLDGDIAVGNRLGLTTIRIRKGRQRTDEPSSAADTPDHDIEELSELPAILSA